MARFGRLGISVGFVVSLGFGGCVMDDSIPSEIDSHALAEEQEQLEPDAGTGEEQPAGDPNFQNDGETQEESADYGDIPGEHPDPEDPSPTTPAEAVALCLEDLRRDSQSLGFFLAVVNLPEPCVSWVDYLVPLLPFGA